MNTLLLIQTSIFSDQGESSRLARKFVDEWRNANLSGEVIARDFAREAVPHLTADTFQAFLTKPEDRTAGQRAAVEYSDALIDELRRAHVIVLGLPMYNFSVPSSLKAYFDHIARAGVTFRYSEKGPEGLLKGKKTYVFAARGGLTAGTPRDTETPYVREFLALLGIDDIEFVYAEGLGMGAATKAQALANAEREVEALAARHSMRYAA